MKKNKSVIKAFANGYSRPVTIYAKTDFKQPLKPKPQGKTVFIEAEESSFKQSYQPIKAMDVSNGKYIQLDSSIKKNLAYDLDIPRNGYYFLYFRVKLKKLRKISIEPR